MEETKVRRSKLESKLVSHPACSGHSIHKANVNNYDIGEWLVLQGSLPIQKAKNLFIWHLNFKHRPVNWNLKHVYFKWNKITPAGYNEGCQLLVQDTHHRRYTLQFILMFMKASITSTTSLQSSRLRSGSSNLLSHLLAELDTSGECQLTNIPELLLPHLHKEKITSSLGSHGSMETRKQPIKTKHCNSQY